MTIFHLPDLGEGLPDAEIHQWYVNVGDHIEIDQPLVSMETAKAVVDVPAPQSGVIMELYGQPGDIIKTGAPLIRFEAEAKATDQGTVVGKLEEHGAVAESTFIIGTHQSAARIRATPQIRLLAKKRQVDLHAVIGTGPNGLITAQDVEMASTTHPLPEGFEPLKGVRRAMLNNMVLSHQQVVPVTIYDEVDIHAWPTDADLTVKLLRAMVEASRAEPALNAWFDDKHVARKCLSEINVGLAMDNEEGLFVPVLTDVANQTDQVLRQTIETYKQALHTRSLTPEQFKGATITLSNFGKFAGRFANPIIVPPTVAILGVGRSYDAAVADEKKAVIHKLLPLSLTFDHRAVTGGEATRFLGALMSALKI
jgi:2-oxoisovalerate dehydrogenase E2 component (dihydrolipoyl transacylase)